MSAATREAFKLLLNMLAVLVHHVDNDEDRNALADDIEGLRELLE